MIGPRDVPSVQDRVRAALDPAARPAGLSLTNRVLVVLILASSAMAVAETEPLLIKPYNRLFQTAEWIFGVLFLLEYGARLWVASEPGSGFKARIKFALSPAAMVDLVSIAACFAPNLSSGMLLRLFRLARILRVAKLGRMTQAWRHLAKAFASRREELLLSLFAGLSLMLISATALYLVEGRVQPDKFGSIPRALWWSVATLTTIGYGDVFPITPLGKVFAGITALTGIGFVAMPTGILAAAFTDAIHEHRKARSDETA